MVLSTGNRPSKSTTDCFQTRWNTNSCKKDFPDLCLLVLVITLANTGSRSDALYINKIKKNPLK